LPPRGRHSDALAGSPGPSRRRRVAGEGGPFFEVRASLEIVGRNGAAPDGRQRAQELLDWLLRNGRREQLCAEVAAISGAPRELVEDALQEVCEHAAAADKCQGTSAGEVYNWLLTATLHRVGKLLGRAHRRREVLVDPDGGLLERLGAGDGADVEVLERERERELRELVRTAIEALNERQRQVAALHSRGLAGREIARHLGSSERRVKHLKAETYAGARDRLVEAAGGGCQDGERLIGRFWFGLASASERSAAHLHLSGCERCATLHQRLELMHEKIAALLPVPAAVQADPGLVERTLHKTAQALTSAKQQLADAAGQAKQHAAAGYARAVEYTPLASARPGAAATAIAGCLALGGGAAGYCIDKGVDPITGLADVVQRSPAKQAQERPKKKPPAEQPPDPPRVATAAPTPAPPEPTPPPAPEQQAATPAPAPAAAPAPVQPAPPPEPPPEPTPPAVQFGEPTNPAQSSPSTAAPSPQPAQPAPAPPSGGGDLYGP
jgi:RNA polymerase sigma factor (sigma-70 family)